MKKMKIEDFIRGYFIGNFDPSIYNTNGMEVTYKNVKKGNLETLGGGCRVSAVICGCAYVYGVGEVKKGDIIRWENDEISYIFALNDFEFFLFRFGKNENVIAGMLEKTDYIKFDDIYSGIWKQLNVLSQRNRKTCKIKDEDVAVIVQGAIGVETPFVTKSIRKYLPNAQIILSTWEQEDVEGCEYDIVIFNKDPGAFETFGNWININRQIISTKAGINAVNRRYVLKLRSDLIMLSSDILNYFQVYMNKNPLYAVFENKILIGELFTCKNNSARDVAFHVSDWFFFGEVEDIHRFYDCVKIFSFENEFEQYKDNEEFPIVYGNETHVATAAYKETHNLCIEDFLSGDLDLMRDSNEYILSNFSILSFCQHGIMNIKKNYWKFSFEYNGVSYKDNGSFKIYTNADTERYEEIQF